MSSPVNISNCERIEHGKKRNKDRETKDKHRDRAKTNKGFLFVKHTSGKIETKFITVIQEKKCHKFKQKSIQSLDLLTSHSHMKVISPDLELSSVSQSSSEDWRTEMMQQILKQNCLFNHFEYILTVHSLKNKSIKQKVLKKMHFVEKQTRSIKHC